MKELVLYMLQVQVRVFEKGCGTYFQKALADPLKAIYINNEDVDCADNSTLTFPVSITANSILDLFDGYDEA